MTESTSTEPSREESYLEWRQRLADRQAAWKQPDETAPTLSSEWDPAALFAKDERVAPSTVDDAGSQTIDLRGDPPAALVSKPAAPAPAPRKAPQKRPAVGPQPAPPKAKAPRPETAARPAAAPKQAPAKAKARKPEPEPLDRQAQFDSVMARLERRAARPIPEKKDPPIADELRELNQRRLDGLITDDEFKARKAELFDRSPKP